MQPEWDEDVVPGSLTLINQPVALGDELVRSAERLDWRHPAQAFVKVREYRRSFGAVDAPQLTHGAYVRSLWTTKQ